VSLILLTLTALAGTTLWLRGAPDPSLVPGDTHLTPPEVAPPAAWSPADDRALAQVAAELAAVKPMKDVFDGELQIMRRLDAAIADVSALREADRPALWSALVFEGYAVDRYFQQTLATDPAAAAYRVELGERIEVRPWVDAIALDPDRLPTRDELPDEAQFVAYQELRARQLLTANATLVAVGLPSTHRFWVDGRAATVDRKNVTAGHHYVATVIDGELVSRGELSVDPGEIAALNPMATLADLADLGEALAGGPRSALLSPPMVNRLSGLSAPVTLVVGDRKQPLRYTVQGNTALRADAPDPRPEGGPLLRVAIGGGWLNDEGFLLQNLDAGAPATRATVNSYGPVLHVGGELGLGPLVGGAGVDLSLPLGDFHTLPVGEERVDTRIRAYPHLAVGLPALQLTGGFWSPFHLGLGPRAHLPFAKYFEVTGGYTYGIGIPRDREDGSRFRPDRAQTAWAAVGYRLARASEGP
jgi:hypothetical protein